MSYRREHLRNSEAWVQRHKDRAQVEERICDDGEFYAVAERDTDTVAAVDALAAEAGRERTGLCEELVVGKARGLVSGYDTAEGRRMLILQALF